uniref:Uncharacterized protein n=1 Tax=Rhizophora mucronata TaxID=61149 RepID=A0A2P2N4D6_RHIMU
MSASSVRTLLGHISASSISGSSEILASLWSFPSVLDPGSTS